MKFQILRNRQLFEAICTWLGLHASQIYLILSTGEQLFQDATQYQRMLPIRRLSTQTHFYILNNFVNESLKCFPGIFATKWHLNKFEQTKRCSNVCLFYVIRVNWHLMVCFDQVKFAESCSAIKFNH